MTNTDLKRLIKLYRLKADKLKEILEITKSRVFTGEEDDAERFENFYEKRNEIFEQISRIDSNIIEFNINDDVMNSLLYKEVEKIKNTIKTYAAEIIEIDKKNKVIMTELMEHIKKNMKNIKNQKIVRRTYQDNYIYDEMKGFFDSKSWMILI